MKIAYFVSRYPNLTETFISRKINQLTKNNHSITICVIQFQLLIRLRNFDDFGKGIQVDNVIVNRISFNFLMYFYSFLYFFFIKPRVLTIVLAEMISVIFKNPKKTIHILYLFWVSIYFAKKKALREADYIHSHFLHVSSIVARWTSLLSQTPYGITNHVINSWFKGNIIKKIITDASICCGDTNQVINHFKNKGAKNIHLIRNGISLKDFPNVNVHLDKNFKKKISILAIGSLRKKKGFNVLLESLSYLKKENIRFSARIIGEGQKRSQLESLCYKLKLNRLVKLPGSMQIEDLNKEYIKADIFVMPSIFTKNSIDGLPTVVIEAMSYGLPVIGTNIGAIPEIILNKRTGLLVRPNEPERLFSAIKLLIQDKILYNDISKNSRSEIFEKYILENNVKEFSNLIKKF